MTENEIDEALEAIPMEVWLSLSSRQQAGVLATYLGEAGTGRALRIDRWGVRKTPIAPLTNVELQALRASLPTHPAGEPDDRWSEGELRALIDSYDAHVASAPKPAAELDVRQITDEQRAAVTRCITRAQYEATAAAILGGSELPVFETKQAEQRPIVGMKGN